MTKALPLLLLGMTLAMPTLWAQLPSEPEVQARAALNEFATAWNSGDIESVRAVLNYPHLTHFGGGLRIARQPAEFIQDFDALREQGWARSRFGEVTVYQVSQNKVNLTVEWARLNANNQIYQSGQAFYVFTRQDGKWGMQYRTGGPSRLTGEPTANEQTVQGASTAVADFFQAFNAADNSALRRVNHVPQVMLNDLTFIEAATEAMPLVNPDFANMRASEDWDHSVYQALNPIIVTPSQVVFELVFERVNSGSEVYRRVPALWVISRKAAVWGVEFRSLMPSTLEAR